jgi:hypothetical protein
MSPEEQNLDMLVAELDRENRLLRARNERLELEAAQRKPWVGLTDEEKQAAMWTDGTFGSGVLWAADKLREKNQ